MGQYHLLVNFDKRQFIYPHQLGDGLKLREMLYSSGGIASALIVLLAISNGRGGGDLDSESEVIGSWGGDRIAIVGDYTDDSDLPTSLDPQPSTIFERCERTDTPVDPSIDISLPAYRDITRDVRAVIEADGFITYQKGDGWIRRLRTA